MHGFFYHKDLTGPEGILFSDDGTENATRESLILRGYVDHPAKAGFNPWGDNAQGKCDEIASDFNNGKIPAIENDDESTQRQIDEDVAIAERNAKELAESHERIRQLESDKERLERSNEQLMDEKNDAGTLKEGFAPPAEDAKSASDLPDVNDPGVQAERERLAAAEQDAA